MLDVSDEYLNLGSWGIFFTRIFNLKAHLRCVFWSQRGPCCWNSDPWSLILGVGVHARVFLFYLSHQMQFVLFFWLCSHRGRETHSSSLSTLEWGKHTHTRVGSVWYNPFLGCVYSQAFRAQLCCIYTPGEQRMLIIPEKPTPYTVCVWILYVAIH